MFKTSTRIAGAVALAGLVSVYGPTPANAGQAGSALEESVTRSTSSAGTLTTTIGGIEIIDEYEDTVEEEITTSLDSSAVTLSLQVSDSGYHGYSPANNIANFDGDLLNDADVSGTSGLTLTQQTNGNASVSVSANSLIDGGALTGDSVIAESAGETAAIILNPAFAISNSALAARVLAIKAIDDAIVAGAAADVTALEFVAADTFELSPESNTANFAGDLTNTAVVADTFGITQVQQQNGNANVQTAFNTLIYAADSFTGDLLPTAP